MNYRCPRVMLSAASSNSGKTLVTCGIMTALMKRGLNVSSFKCGPDYIDPMFHTKVIGARSRNLDTFFTDDNTTRYLFCRSASEISVIEGVMGFYDGKGDDLDGSSYHVSNVIDAPVILIVNTKGMADTVVAVVKGLKEYRRNNVKGVILNNMSASVYPGIKEKIEREVGIRVIGHIPKLDDSMTLSSRHLGLVLPDEIPELRETLLRLAKQLEMTLDLDLLIEMANGAEELSYEPIEVPKLDGKVRIGLADDESFCFTYADNLQLLTDMGAEIVRFSPMRDRDLPKDIDGMILSGGYPELHADILENNKAMREQIRGSLENGMPCIAECGGFMYLNREMMDSEGRMHEMVSFLNGECEKTPRLVRFGYISLMSKEDSMLLRKGESVRGHEFHYWDCTENGNRYTATKTSGKQYDCVIANEKLYAGYPHLYYYSNPEVAFRFLSACLRYKRGE